MTSTQHAALAVLHALPPILQTHRITSTEEHFINFDNCETFSRLIEKYYDQILIPTAHADSVHSIESQRQLEYCAQVHRLQKQLSSSSIFKTIPLDNIPVPVKFT